ncbi:MAG: two-component regulator propeller domain-containing protein [Bacteroidales bacterium]
MMRQTLILFGILCCTLVGGQPTGYQLFDNTVLSPEARSVRCFLQDEQGLLWMGTNKGLFSYDGYRASPHFQPGSPESLTIHCGLFYPEGNLLLGTEQGLLMYNYHTDKYLPFEIEIPNDIRAMALTENDLWLGCADGLYRYHFANQQLTQLFDSPGEGRRTGIINALLIDRGYLYVGANGLFGRVSLTDYRYQPFDGDGGGRRMVNALQIDPHRNCIWIGEANRLTRFNLSDGTFRSYPGFPVVKSIALDADRNLILGTDNGLFVFDLERSQQFVHNTQRYYSLANNIVWSLYTDPFDNLWIGTDHGISMAPRHRQFEYLPIFHFTGTAEGNQFSTLYRDTKGTYWLGGDNGVLRTRSLTGVDSTLCWYSMSNPASYLRHNHVRHILEDSAHNLWLATDFGVCRYDTVTRQFIPYLVSSPNSSENANWAYHLAEDDSGRLWIASFDGGLFRVDKTRLYNRQYLHTADAHYSTRSGLASNNIDQIAFDKTGTLWALHRNHRVDAIDPATGSVTSVKTDTCTNQQPVQCLLSDGNQAIWLGFRNGVCRIDPVTRQSKTLRFSEAGNAVVYSLLAVNQTLWASSTEGLWIIDTVDFSVRHIGVGDRFFTSAFYDKSREEVLLGGVDAIAISSPALSEYSSPRGKPIISSILVNGKRYENPPGQPAIRYASRIALPYNQNNLTVQFSDLQYASGGLRRSYLYTLNHDTRNWIAINAHQQAISLNKLSPGKYTLTLAEKGANNSPPQPLTSFQIVIHPPWYYSRVALAIYLLLLTALVFWIINFFRQKNNLKIARIEREKTAEQAQLKMDFFTNIAHEFKTPLSLITAPLSRMMQEKKFKSELGSLELIHQSAIKLNTLVQQAIAYYRDDSETTPGLALARIELVSFVKSLFEAYQAPMRQKEIAFVFHAKADTLYLEVDPIKMESIVNNLLSNAAKYTPRGGTILLSLQWLPEAQSVELVVSDSGVGIEPKEQPYHFQRFYQSPDNKEKGGTGIGLYLVKRFVEMHGGTVGVVSKPGEGSTFVVRLPAAPSIPFAPSRSAAASSAPEPNPEAEAMIAPDPSRELLPDPAGEGAAEKPLLVIVEDNVAIAQFIAQSLMPEFRCLVAHNGKSGLKICIDLLPDLIIADVMMPVMDGLEMSRQLKTHLPTSTIPIILLTARDDKATELQSIHLKIDAFIAKPFNFDVLYSRVKQLLEARQNWAKKQRIQALSTPVAGAVVSDDEKFLAGTTRLIEEQMTNPDLNVSFLCERMQLSQKQLYRKIKALTGLTPVDYIKSIRMKKAAILLSNKNFTVSEVMYKVGFSNHSYFAKCFHHAFGKNPGQYQES